MNALILLVFLCTESGECDFYRYPQYLESRAECKEAVGMVIEGVLKDPDWYRSGALRDTTGPLTPMVAFCGAKQK